MKLNLIGLGKLSTKLVEKLFDEEDCYKTCYENSIVDSNNLEENEKEYDELKNVHYNSEQDISETYLFVEGKYGIAGITLKLLQNYTNKPITVFYIKSYCNNELEKKNQHFTINVLQEYARSGMFMSIFIIDYSDMINDIIQNIPETDTFDYNDIDKFFIDKLLFCVHVYWRLCNETYLSGEKINFNDTIYRTKTFFDITESGIKQYYNLQYPVSLIYVKGVKSKNNKKEIIELQAFKNFVQDKGQVCIFLSSDEQFTVGIVETKIIQESNYI